MVCKAFSASSALAMILASAGGAPEEVGADPLLPDVIIGGGFIGMERAADREPIMFAMELLLAGGMIPRC